MGVAGYLTSIRRNGTATALSSEPMTASTVTNTYVTTSTAKDLWNRNTVPTFAAGGSTISSTDVSSINYLFGKVTFASTHGSTNVTVTGSYYPLTTIGGGYSYTLTQENVDLDDTDYDVTNGYRSHFMGIKDISVSVSRWYAQDNTFFTAVNARNPVVLEINPGGQSLSCRGYFHTLSEAFSGDVNALNQSDLEFVVDGTTTATFAWSDE